MSLKKFDIVILYFNIHLIKEFIQANLALYLFFVFFYTKFKDLNKQSWLFICF